MMKNIVSAILMLSVSLVFSLGNAAEKDTKTFQPWHKRLSTQCIKCHQQEKPTKAIGAFKCAECHETPENMAKETAELGTRNPHTSIHYGTALPCEECHKEHSEPFNLCFEACHRTWPNTIPGAKPKP